MASSDLVKKTHGQHPASRAVYGLALTGVMIVMVSFAVSIGLAVSTGDYYSHAKAARDAAETGSGLLSQIGTIGAVGAWLEPFRFVGIALLFTGISTALAIVVSSIQLRGDVMVQTVPAIVARNRQPRGGTR